MKSALSIALSIICLVGSVLPVAAQEKTETTGSFDGRSPATDFGSRLRNASRCSVHVGNFDHCTNTCVDGAHVLRTSVTASAYDESAPG